MNEAVKQDILSLLDSVIGILASEEETDLVELEELSNKIIHSASIFQDEDSISIALLIYSLYKGNLALLTTRLNFLESAGVLKIKAADIDEFKH